MGYTKPKTDWTGSAKVRDENFNNIESNIAIAIGMATNTTVFNADGSILTTFADGSSSLTTFESDGSIVDTRYSPMGIVIDKKKVTFNADGSISEVLLI